MKFLHFLISKAFLKSLAISIGILVVLFILTSQGLKLYTYHGKYIQVPDLEGMTENQIIKTLQDKDLRYDISDSVYSRKHLPGAVVEQLPLKGAKVKKNRKIFLIVNATTPEMVLMPNLKDVSLRQAKNILQSAGLEVGDVIYVHSPYSGLVINQYFDNIPIEPGARVQKMAAIDIEVGKGLGNKLNHIPKLKGMNLRNAREALSKSGMNMGVIVEDHTSKEHRDESFIWKQRPSHDTGPVRMGTAIDVWMTMDSALLKKDTTLTKEQILDENVPGNTNDH